MENEKLKVENAQLLKGDGLSLPKSWKMKKLEKVCEKIFAGGDKPKEFSKYKTNEFSIPIFSNGEKNKGLYGFTNVARINKPSITISGRGTIGYSEIRTEPFVPIVRLITLLPNDDKIDIHFFHYGLKNINFSNSGSSIPQLTVPMVKGYSIPLPPLKQQKQIVAILDKAFTAIDKAKTNAQQNLTNAKELFESYLQNVFSTKGDDWVEKSLGEVANVTYGFTEKSTEEGDFRYVRITDIDKNGELIPKGKKFINSSKDSKDFILQNNDIVMARTGATFAKLLLYKDIEPSIYASYLIKIDFTEDIDNEFYWFFSKTNSYWEQANVLSTGAAQPHFNGKALKQVLFPYPKSLTTQKKLITEFRKLQAETTKLEVIYSQKIADLEELKKSILQKAFSGALTQKELV